MDSDLTKALRLGDVAALERLGCTVRGFAAGTLRAEKEAKPVDNGDGTFTRTIPFTFVAPEVFEVPYGLVIMLAVETKCEVNGRDWRKRSKRSNAAWKAASKTLGPHLRALADFSEAFHADKGLRVTMTRLGGRKVDQSNLPSCLKGVEDALAFILGADDGDPRWHPVFKQEPGGLVGVRVELEVIQ